MTIKFAENNEKKVLNLIDDLTLKCNSKLIAGVMIGLGRIEGYMIGLHFTCNKVWPTNYTNKPVVIVWKWSGTLKCQRWSCIGSA